ncbi:porin [Woodsholea maritima]|uniref:porin n=1 Tax=Woodsholea maritima TaxID=240237 RepID=UPI00039ECCD9|nr:porin [Woodsholea maritima]
MSAVVCTPTFAQDSASLGPFDLTLEGEADVLLASHSGYVHQDTPYFDAQVRLIAEAITEKGWRWGTRLGVEAQRDNGRRGSRLFLDEAGAARSGLISGYFSGKARDEGGAEAQLSIAQAYLKTPYGEVRVGPGEGAARLELEAMPGVFRLMRADQGLIDPSGLAGVTTRNTLSGFAPKVSVQTQRIFGFRFSGAYTPDGDQCGPQICTRDVDLDAVYDLALSFDYTLRPQDLRLSAGISASWGEIEDTGALYQDAWIYSAQGVLEHGTWAFGVAWLSTNDGLMQGRYDAYTASLTYGVGDWLYGLELAESDHSAWDMTSRSAQIGLSRWFDGGFLIGTGVAYTQNDFGVHSLKGDLTRETTQIFLETGLRF